MYVVYVLKRMRTESSILLSKYLPLGFNFGAFKINLKGAMLHILSITPLGKGEIGWQTAYQPKFHSSSCKEMDLNINVRISIVD